jgi:hypothetical protein
VRKGVCHQVTYIAHSRNSREKTGKLIPRCKAGLEQRQGGVGGSTWSSSGRKNRTEGRNGGKPVMEDKLIHPL